MPYPGEFYRLVAIGDLYGDTFNFTLSMVPTALGELTLPPVTQALADSIGLIVGAWWSNTNAGEGPRVSDKARLLSVKFNRIGPDGRYADPETREWVSAVPIPGTFSSAFPAQLATAVTLKTAVPRGRASRGRFYLPPNAMMSPIDNNGLASATAAQALADSAKFLIDDLNTNGTLVSRVGVASNAGVGRFEHVTSVAVGRVIDTIRSRRSALSEDYQETVL